MKGVDAKGDPLGIDETGGKIGVWATPAGDGKGDIPDEPDSHGSL